MRSKITGSLLVIVAAAVFTAGALVLNDDSPGRATAAPAASQTGGYAAPARAGAGAAPAVLEIRGFAFGGVTAGAGGRVSIQNRDGVQHTVTADSGAFDSGRIGPNATGTVVAPAKASSYRFTCLIHPQMSGTLVVR